MVNTTQFYKTKVALAVVLSLGLAACGDSEGDAGSTSTSSSTVDASQPTVGNQDQLTGTVSGKVQDTNGRPVAGATVGFMGMSTTTDANGNYVFTDVPVTNLNGNNDDGTGNEADEIVSALTVTITGPDGYIGAVVNVTPQAVVNNTGTNQSNGSSSDVTASTFVDGFVAEAGIAVIAEESAMVTGYLRIGNATPAEGEVVYLDFTGYNGTVLTNNTASGSAGGTAGASVTLTPGEYTAITAADGSFTFENVPADSTFVLGVTGKTISTSDTDGSGVVATDGGIAVGTPLEQDENFLGTFEVVDNDFAVEVDATYNPWVSSVDGVLNPTVGIVDGGKTYGDLNDGINKEVTINFSEPLDAATFDTTKVVVAETGAQYIATDSVILSDDGTSLTVVFTEELDPGTKFTVFIAQASSIDADGDALNITRNVTNTHTNAAPITDGSATTIVYDALNSITNKAKYIEVNLCTYIDGTAGVEGASAVQVFDESTSTDGGSVGLQAYSDAFRDAENSEDNGDADTDDIAQLNGQADTEVKLKDLGDAVLAVIGGGETLDDVDSDFPWIEVTPGNASSYSINTAVKDADDSVVASGTDFAGTSGSRDHGVDGADDGDTVSVTFMDDFGVAASSATVTLVDALPPTTVLQENYNLYSVGGYDQILSTAGEANYGDGGEVANDGTSATAGNPLIWIQPRHLQQKGSNNSAPSRSATNTYGSLTDLSGRVDAGETATDMDSSTSILNRPTYDKAGFAAWGAVSNEIGIDFSENIALTTTAVTPSGISTGLSGYLANNNVADNVDGITLANAADLVQVTVADVMSLANVDNTGFLDFVGAVSDTSDAENVATADSNAKVIFRDAMPPMLTSAEWDGTSIEMVFNEAVSIDTTTTITLVHPVTAATQSVTLNPAVASTSNTGFTISADGTTVVVNTVGVAGLSAIFAGDVTANDPTVDEYFYDDGGNSTADDQHAILRWDNIEDANGNNWNTFTPNGADVDGSQAAAGTTFANRYQVEAPQFLAVNGLGAFTVSPQNIIGLDANGALDDDGNFVLTLDFSHPIDVTNATGIDTSNDGVIQENELAALFYFDIDGNNTLDADGVDNTAGNSDDEDIVTGLDDLTLSNNNQTITISIDRDDDAFTVGTAYIRMQAPVLSSFIATESILQDFNIRN